MSEPNEPDEPSEYLSPAGMRWWLEKELRNVQKELDLRRKEAIDFVTAYERKELTAEEADERLARYDSRWHPALHGLNAGDYSDDSQLLSAIDERCSVEHAAFVSREQHRAKLERQLNRTRRHLDNPDEPEKRSR